MRRADIIQLDHNFRPIDPNRRQCDRTLWEVRCCRASLGLFLVSTYFLMFIGGSYYVRVYECEPVLTNHT